MRVLGDEYVKSEFRAHKNVENPMHIVSGSENDRVKLFAKSQSYEIGFLTEWQMYAQKIEGNFWQGEKIDKGKIDKMSGIHHGN